LFSGAAASAGPSPSSGFAASASSSVDTGSAASAALSPVLRFRGCASGGELARATRQPPGTAQRVRHARQTCGTWRAPGHRSAAAARTALRLGWRADSVRCCSRLARGRAVRAGRRVAGAAHGESACARGVVSNRHGMAFSGTQQLAAGSPWQAHGTRLPRLVRNTRRPRCRGARKGRSAQAADTQAFRQQFASRQAGPHSRVACADAPHDDAPEKRVAQRRKERRGASAARADVSKALAALLRARFSGVSSLHTSRFRVLHA
jgi:hypothetical protein